MIKLAKILIIFSFFKLSATNINLFVEIPKHDRNGRPTRSFFIVKDRQSEGLSINIGSQEVKKGLAKFILSNFRCTKKQLRPALDQIEVVLWKNKKTGLESALVSFPCRIVTPSSKLIFGPLSEKLPKKVLNAEKHSLSSFAKLTRSKPSDNSSKIYSPWTRKHLQDFGLGQAEISNLLAMPKFSGNLGIDGKEFKANPARSELASQILAGLSIVGQTSRGSAKLDDLKKENREKFISQKTPAELRAICNPNKTVQVRISSIDPAAKIFGRTKFDLSMAQLLDATKNTNYYVCSTEPKFKEVIKAIKDGDIDWEGDAKLRNGLTSVAMVSQGLPMVHFKPDGRIEGRTKISKETLSIVSVAAPNMVNEFFIKSTKTLKPWFYGVMLRHHMALVGATVSRISADQTRAILFDVGRGLGAFMRVSRADRREELAKIYYASLFDALAALDKDLRKKLLICVCTLGNQPSKGSGATAHTKTYGQIFDKEYQKALSRHGVKSLPIVRFDANTLRSALSLMGKYSDLSVYLTNAANISTAALGIHPLGNIFWKHGAQEEILACQVMIAHTFSLRDMAVKAGIIDSSEDFLNQKNWVDVMQFFKTDGQSSVAEE